jgi:universal stress protein E
MSPSAMTIIMESGTEYLYWVGSGSSYPNRLTVCSQVVKQPVSASSLFHGESLQCARSGNSTSQRNQFDCHFQFEYCVIMNRFSNMLFVAVSDIDDSAAFGQAMTLADNNQAQVTVVGLVDALDIRNANGSTAASKLLDALVEQKREQLEILVQGTSLSGPKIEIKVLVGKAFVEIIREVLRHQRDLVIKSVENTESIGQQLFGSTDMKLLRKCPCPVWMIKSTQQQGYRDILVGLEYEPENTQNDTLNRQLLEMATSLALSNFSELHIVHAWTLQFENFLRSRRLDNSDAEVDAMVNEEENRRKQWLADIVNECCARQGKETSDYLKPQFHLLKGEARNVVPECVKKLGVELVVLGTIGRTGVPGFIIGNTAEAILNRIDCSVLAIKPVGFVSPVTLEA